MRSSPLVLLAVVGVACSSGGSDRPVDIPGDRLIVPRGTTYSLVGSHCYATVRIDGTVNITPSDGSTGGALELVADSLELGATGALLGLGAGFPGAPLASTDSVGGHQGTGPGAGCGGGYGGSVGQGGAGAGHGGAGGTTATTNTHAASCNVCDVPTVAHCRGAAGTTYDVAEDASAGLGSGGGAAGNSSGCIDGSQGGAGGASVVLRAANMVIAGDIVVDGSSPSPIESPTCTYDAYRPGGGGGAGGTIVLASNDLTITSSSTLSALGGQGGASLGSTNLESPEDPEATSAWAWAGGGGGGGRIKIFAPVRSVEGSVLVTGGLGGTVALPSDPNSYVGLPGADGTSFEGDTVPVDLATFTCP